MSLARIAYKKKSLHTFHEHPFLINCKNLCRFWHGHSTHLHMPLGDAVHHLASTAQPRAHRNGTSVYISTYGVVEYCASENVTPENFWFHLYAGVK